MLWEEVAAAARCRSVPVNRAAPLIFPNPVLSHCFDPFLPEMPIHFATHQHNKSGRGKGGWPTKNAAAHHSKRGRLGKSKHPKQGES